MPRILIATLALVAFLAVPATADVVHLTNGKTLEGKVTESAGSVVVELPGGKITLPREEVARIERKETLEDVYRARRAELAEDDVEGLFRLALWLREEGWEKKAREEFAAVVKLDPDHRGAHYGLGHVRYDDRWMTEDEAMEAQGYVRHEGRWVTAEEKALLARDRDYRERVLALQGKVNRLVQAMASPSPSVRKRYHRQLVTMAREIESPELEKAAGEVKAWYDEAYRLLAQRALLEVRAQVATLKRPIPTFTTSLGAGTVPVTLHLPEVSLISIGTTVSVPAGR